MFEKEKMINGEIYNPEDEQLKKERLVCKDTCYEYNNLRPSLLKERENIIKNLLGKTGNSILIEQPFYCDYGYNIEVGENFYANHGLVILDPAKVLFGDNIFIGPNCSFYTPIHPIDATERNSYKEYAKQIIVGSNVWFGGNVTVLPDVKIGSNVVIGAGSVVTKDIPDNVVAVGNPCKVLRDITEDDKIFDKNL